MKGYEQLAAALADALGPLYRVSLVGLGGSVRPFGADANDMTSLGADIPLPGSRQKLRLEMNAARLRDAHQTLHVLLPASTDTSTQSFQHLEGALDELLIQAESEIGRSIAEMSREDRQRLVRFLDERGAFALRKAVERVADALGVSRFTVYNYLDSVRGS